MTSFARNAELRLRMYTAYSQPRLSEKRQVLRDLLTARQELATTLGYASYADLATADQMIGSADQCGEAARAGR